MDCYSKSRRAYSPHPCTPALKRWINTLIQYMCSEHLPGPGTELGSGKARVNGADTVLAWGTLLSNRGNLWLKAVARECVKCCGE